MGKNWQKWAKSVKICKPINKKPYKKIKIYIIKEVKRKRYKKKKKKKSF